MTHNGERKNAAVLRPLTLTSRQGAKPLSYLSGGLRSPIQYVKTCATFLRVLCAVHQNRKRLTTYSIKRRNPSLISQSFQMQLEKITAYLQNLDYVITLRYKTDTEAKTNANSNRPVVRTNSPGLIGLDPREVTSKDSWCIAHNGEQNNAVVFATINIGKLAGSKNHWATSICLGHFFHGL